MRAQLCPGVEVSRETIARLEQFAALVTKWTAHINLVSRQDARAIWSRHIVDSAQLFVATGRPVRHWADLGAGGGFPGIVIGLIAAELSPASRLTLVESDQRKATFLRTALREVGLAATVHAQRIENLDALGADVISARALTDLSGLIRLAVPHMSPDGILLFPKGRRADAEIAAARAEWTFDLGTQPSITDPEARILRIERITLARPEP
jgi:16S rRNA (guanine527-N7)-methyltransferase